MVAGHGVVVRQLFYWKVWKLESSLGWLAACIHCLLRYWESGCDLVPIYDESTYQFNGIDGIL